MYDERINVASTNAFNRGGAINAYYASDDKSEVIIMEVDDSYVIFCIFPSHFGYEEEVFFLSTDTLTCGIRYNRFRVTLYLVMSLQCNNMVRMTTFCKWRWSQF